jgi:hypothetical protein
MATRRSNRKASSAAAKPQGFVVRIHWSRAFVITHGRVFDSVDAAVKLMLRVNDRARISTVAWNYVDRDGATQPLAEFARAAAWNLGDRFALIENA